MRYAPDFPQKDMYASSFFLKLCQLFSPVYYDNININLNMNNINLNLQQ